MISECRRLSAVIDLCGKRSTQTLFQEVPRKEEKREGNSLNREHSQEKTHISVWLAFSCYFSLVLIGSQLRVALWKCLSNKKKDELQPTTSKELSPTNNIHVPWEWVLLLEPSDKISLSQHLHCNLVKGLETKAPNYIKPRFLAHKICAITNVLLL